MIQSQRPALSCLALLTVLSACGGSKGSGDSPVVVYSTLVVANSKTATDNGSYQMTSADACSRNTDTGRADVTLSQGSGKASLAIAIKDYSATPKSYTCKQASDNQSSATDVGGKFETCSVEVKVPSAAGASTLNAYSMARDSTTIKPFTFGGTCTVDVTTAIPNIVGKVTCTKLVQTILQGSPRNPIDPAVTADASGDFSCTFR